MAEKKEQATIPKTMKMPPSVPLPILQAHQKIYMHYPHLVGKSIYEEHVKSCPVCSGNNSTEYYINQFEPHVWNNFSATEKELVLDILDPVSWARRNITINGKPFEPRVSQYGFPYQASIMRCTSKRLVVRAGRRLGKSQSIVLRLLHKLFTNQKFRIVIFTPFASQIETLWKMIHDAINSSDNLKSQVVRSVKTPFHLLELSNGSTIQAFVGGSEAIRSTAADLVYIDEASFVKQEVLDAVIALLMEKPDTELVMSSTPKGSIDYFMERTRDPRYVAFHFPANVYSPIWNDEMEEETRAELTETGYLHEVLAEVSAGSDRVYKDKYISAALSNYNYPGRPVEEGWIYSMGTDWNDKGTGAHIVIVGYNPNRQGRKYKIWHRDVVDVEEFTQLAAVEKIVQLNRIWQPEFIYLDRGFGYTNEELLHKVGMNAGSNSADRRLLDRLKSIFFSEKIPIYDPWTKTKVMQPVKPFMVNQTVKLFEDGYIEISSKDDKLIKQLENYIVVQYGSNGMPKYGSASPKIGDHSLDALHLAVLAFVLEATELGHAKPVLDIKNVGTSLRQTAKSKQEDLADQVGHVVTMTPGMQADKERERREFEQANGIDRSRMIEPRHAPGQHARTFGSIGTNPFIRRRREKPSRSNF